MIITSESSGATRDTDLDRDLDAADQSASAPFASDVPTVMEFDDCTGGLHDGNASGGPCVRFGAVHSLYAGTSDVTSGLPTAGAGAWPRQS